MAKKDKTISCRISENRLAQIDKQCETLHLTRTNYLSMLLDGGGVQCGAHDQEIAQCLCRIQIALAKEGLENADITKEVNNICRMLLS